MQDLTSEIRIQTTRSGGKGGQNVNKVETAVIAYFDVGASALLTSEQKELVQQRLANRISTKGELVVRSQAYRTQLENKEDAISKLTELVTGALKKKKMRIPTKTPKGVKEKRLENKKRTADVKQGRRRMRPGDF